MTNDFGDLLGALRARETVGVTKDVGRVSKIALDEGRVFDAFDGHSVPRGIEMR